MINSNILEYITPSHETLLRFGLILYMCFLVLGPEPYNTTYSLCVETIATVVAVVASCFFIAFLRSGTPADNHILKRQMLLNFIVKLFFYPHYFIGLYIGFQGQNPDSFSKFMSTTLLSYSSARIWFILCAAMYLLISAYRALHFISPSLYRSLNTNLCHRLSILFLIVLVTTEIILSHTLWSSSRCDITSEGKTIHSFSYEFFNTNHTSKIDLEISNEDWISNTTDPSYNDLVMENVVNQLLALNSSDTYLRSSNLSISNNSSIHFVSKRICNFFPTARILLLSIMLLEFIRVYVAIARKVRKIKKKADYPSLKRQSPGFSGQGTQIKFSNNATVNPESQIDMPETPIQDIAIKTDPVDSGLTRCEIDSKVFIHGDFIITTASVHSPPVCRTTPENFNGLPNIPTVKKPTLMNCGPTPLRVLSDENPDEIETASTPVPPHPLGACASSQPSAQSKHLQKLQHRLFNNSSSAHSRLIYIPGEIDTTELKNYFILLVKRSYSLIIIILLFFLISFLLPIKFYYLSKLWLQFAIYKLDLFFVPVFWLMTDENVLRYSLQHVQNCVGNLKNLFNL